MPDGAFTVTVTGVFQFVVHANNESSAEALALTQVQAVLSRLEDFQEENLMSVFVEKKEGE